MTRFALMWELGDNTVLHTIPVDAPPSLSSIAGKVRRKELDEMSTDEVRLLDGVVRGRDWHAVLGEVLDGLGCGRGAVREVVCELRPSGEVQVDLAVGRLRMQSLPAEDGDEGDDVVGDPVDLSELLEVLAEEAEPLPAAQAPPTLFPQGDGAAALAQLDALLAALPAAGAERAQAALNALHAVVPAESGAVLWRTGERLRFVAATGPKATAVLGVEINLHQGIAGLVARTGAPLLLRHARHDPNHLRDLDERTGYRTRALLAAPIGDSLPAQAVIELINPRVVGGFVGWHREALARAAAALG
ncbi:MAG: GAF domain-containing protein [Deltaproteobacteria bacterium]|nr:GAF domain-containing protein [Deltaproteobacteria bacterium]